MLGVWLSEVEISGVRCLNTRSMRFEVWPGTVGRAGRSLT